MLNLRTIAIGTVAAGLLLATLKLSTPQPDVTTQGAELSAEDRTALYLDAMERSEAAAEAWPQSQNAIVTDFWQAIHEKNWDVVTMYCPGSSKDDFFMYDKWTPSPVKAIGQPEPHPEAPGVMLLPIKVDFPGYPNKTIKLATMHLQDGRLAIDGQHTIWW